MALQMLLGTGQRKISWIHVRHEETAGFAAGAEAHLTENLAVCAGSFWTRKYAFDKRTLRLLLSQSTHLGTAAHIPSTEIGSLYFQETHLNFCSMNAVTTASLSLMQIRFHVFLILLCELPFHSLEFLSLSFQVMWLSKKGPCPIDPLYP